MLNTIFFAEEPRPMIIKSPPEGVEPYMYVVRWAKIRTGGLPIKEFMFRFREVNLAQLFYKQGKVI